MIYFERIEVVNKLDPNSGMFHFYDLYLTYLGIDYLLLQILAQWFIRSFFHLSHNSVTTISKISWVLDANKLYCSISSP